MVLEAAVGSPGRGREFPGAPCRFWLRVTGVLWRIGPGDDLEDGFGDQARLVVVDGVACAVGDDVLALGCPGGEAGLQGGACAAGAGTRGLR